MKIRRLFWMFFDPLCDCFVGLTIVILPIIIGVTIVNVVSLIALFAGNLPTMRLTAYLCGPMTGQTFEQCSTWRHEAESRLRDLYVCVSPLRGKKDYLPPIPLEAFANVENEVGAVLSGAKGILSRDTWDVRRCDVTLAIFQNTDRVSIGSVMEIAFAHAYRKPIVAVIDERHHHPFVVEAVTHMCPDFDTAIEVMRRLT